MTWDRYKPSKQIRFKTSMLRSDLCDFSDAYIVVKGDIALRKTNGRWIFGIKNKVLALKNNVPFTNCISKINNVITANGEHLDAVMPMYNLLEYSKNYRKTQQEVFAIITEMSLIIFLLTIMTLLMLIITQEL